MSNNTNLHKAQKAKRDEFCTTFDTVKNELQHYPNCFRNKVVYCNCDDPYVSEFFKYFMVNFNILGLKGLICTCYAESKASRQRLNKTDDEYSGKPYKAEITRADIEKLCLEYGKLTRETTERYINEHNKIEILKGNGSFDSPECLELLKASDVVVTNPPFSLFKTFLPLLVEYQKDFLLIGNMNAITYKSIFILIKQNVVFTGYTHPTKFIKPDGSIKQFGNISWFTSFNTKSDIKPLNLHEKYTPEKYPKYDNYDAINVDRVADIPCNFYGIMGVPITFMHIWNPNQFKVIGYDHDLKGNGGIGVAEGQFEIAGKGIYRRILIQRKL